MRAFVAFIVLPAMVLSAMVLSIVVLSIMGSGRTAAADFPLPSPNFDAEPPHAHWGGLYLGLNGGGGLGSSQWTQNLISTSVFNTDGFLVGGTIGFNYPVSAVLFGVEGDLDWSSLNGSVGNCAVNGGGAVAACETKNNVLGTVRGRMGYAFERTLIYVTGGAAFGDVQTGLNPPATFDSTTKIGWAAGVGLEFALTDAWSAKAEYLFVDLGTATCASAANCGSAAGASASLTENLVRGGFNYRFSW